jgi:hypothetical protein
MLMRAAAFLLVLIPILCANPSAPADAAACSDDYATIETIRGTIMEIRPSPEPFRSADIYLSGPAPCTRIWMQVLKPDAEKCRIGGAIVVKGIVTEDVENHSWEIGSGKNDYMTLGDDFTCG